jgi:hypothetical protein
MGTIIERTRKDGSKAFIAQILVKKGGATVHREAQTFDRKPAANAWIVKREAELKRPGGLEQKEDPALSTVIDRYIAESKSAVLGTKAQVLKTIKNSDLGETKCGEITSNTSLNFKTWNGSHDLLIKISSDVIAAHGTRPESSRQDKAADQAALSLNAGRR